MGIIVQSNDSGFGIFKLAFFGVSAIEPVYIVYTLIITLMVLVFGVIIFNRVEAGFMDTV